MKRTLLFLTIFLFLFSCTSEKKKALQYFSLAKISFDKKEYKIADSLCSLSILKDSANYKALILRAKIKSKQGMFNEAIDILKFTLKFRKSLDSIYFLLADYNFQLAWDTRIAKGKGSTLENEYWNLSESFYDSTLKYNVYYYTAYLNKSKVLHNLDDYNNSIIIINKAISLFPDSLGLIMNRGVEKIYLGDKAGAIRDLKNSIATGKLDSIDLAITYRYLSNIYSDYKRYDTAITILTSAIKFNPKDYLLFATRAELYIKINKKDSACDDLRSAADLGLVRVYKKIQEYCK